jgi:hypothetical protein
VRCKVWFMAMVLFGLGGCIPLPHFVSIAPEVSGKIVRSGKPVANASLAVVVGSTAESIGKTNADGTFSLERPYEFHLFFAPLVAPIRVNGWALEIEDGDYSTSIWHGLNNQEQDASLVLFCDLDRSRRFVDFDESSNLAAIEMRKQSWNKGISLPEDCQTVKKSFEQSLLIKLTNF